MSANNGTGLQPEIVVYYINPETGQVYAEVGGRVFEMNIGDDVTEDVECDISDFEAVRVFDPRESEFYDADGLRLDGEDYDFPNTEDGD